MVRVRTVRRASSPRVNQVTRAKKIAAVTATIAIVTKSKRNKKKRKNRRSPRRSTYQQLLLRSRVAT